MKDNQSLHISPTSVTCNLTLLPISDVDVEGPATIKRNIVGLVTHTSSIVTRTDAAEPEMLPHLFQVFLFLV